MSSLEKTATPSVSKGPDRSSLIIWASFLVLTLAWGSSFILVKRGIAAFSPWQVADLRLSSAFLVLGGMAFFHIKLIPKHKLPYILFTSLTGLLIPAYLFCYAQLGVSSSVVGVLNALTPAFTFIVGISFFKQPAKWMQVLGLFIGFIGSAMLIVINSKGGFSINAYAFCIVAAAFCYGLNVNIIKRYLYDVNPLHMTTVGVSMAGILALGHLMTTNWIEVFQTAPKGHSAMLAAVTLGCIGTAFSQVVFNRLLSYSSAVFASSITYFVPIVAIMWGVWDGEVLLFWHYIGILCIIGGILILNRVK